MPQAATSDPVSILLVDDDPGILETLVDIFEDMGFRAEPATSGASALARIREQFFNLALLDIRLPDMPGTDLLVEARRLQPDMLCIMATGDASLPSAVESLNRGAYAYLQKPIEVPEVKATVRRALEQQRLEFHLRALRDITDHTLAILDLDELLPQMLDRFLGYHGADGGAIYLLEPVTKQLVLRAVRGPAEQCAAPLRVGEGLAGAAAADLEPKTAAGAALAHDPIAAAGVRAAIAAPLLGREQRLIGAIRLDRTAERPFSSEDRSLLQVLSVRTGILVDLRAEAEAYRELAGSLVERIELPERLNEISRHLRRVAGASRCLIWLSGPRGLACERSSTGFTASQFRQLRRAQVEEDELSPVLTALLDTGLASVVRDPREVGLPACDLLAEWGLRAALLVPFRLEGRTIGLAVLDEPGEERRFTQGQLRQATTIASMAAGAIQQARTIQEERDTLRTLAESFLSEPPALEGIQIAKLYKPAFDVAQIGGDYYDFLQLAPRRLAIVIGDVCGKGLAAAVYTAMAKYMLRAYALENHSPSWVISRLNHALYNQMSEESMYITLFLGILDLESRTLRYTNAGHPPPILYRAAGGETVELLPTGGMVGAVEEMPFSEDEVTMEPGSVLALFTDGVTEARVGQEMLESEGVREVLRAHASEDASAIVEAIYARAHDFAGGQLKDDVAIVVART